MMRSMTRRSRSGRTAKLPPETATSASGSGKSAKAANKEAELLVKALGRAELEDLVLSKLSSNSKITLADLKAAQPTPPEEQVHKPGGRKADPRLSSWSDARVNQLHTDFAQFDTNGDGVISLDEFIKIMMRPINGKAPEFEEAELVYMFQEMDTDGGGSVCYDEFAEAWAIEEDHGDGSGMVGIGA